MAPIIDGTYGRDSDGVEYAKLSPTPTQLRRLETALTWATDRLATASSSPDVIEKKLRQTLEREAPGLASMVDRALGEKNNRSANLAAWIAVLLQVIQMIVGGQSQSVSESEIARIVQQVENHRTEDEQGGIPVQPPTAPLIERKA